MGSPTRRAPALDCPHRPPCPGCPRWGAGGVEPGAYAALAELAREAGLEAPPAVIEGAPLAYRHRARLAVRGRARSPKIGIFQEGSHRITDIPRCLVHHPLVNRVAAVVKQALRETDTAPYAEAPHRGVLRYVQIVVERSSQSAQLVLVANGEDPEACRPAAEVIRRELGAELHSLWWNGNTGRGNTILGPHWERLGGAEAVREVIGGVEVFFPPGAFGQANLDLADHMAARVSSWVPDAATVVELYAGCGAMGLQLLGRCGALHFNERGGDSLRGLELSLARRPDAERRRARIHAGDAGADADLHAACSGADVVIADPPRKGLDPPLLEVLAERPPRRLVYVSCGLPALLAQSRRLLESGHLALAALEAWALFPHTDQIETLALFDRI
ncbi:MAG: class I SAM-dependent RNA methyltransferase [Deltaproteobacteria bacterium]|nr:class I SAM-dependent RNA methyltransferase [Deltaproteobacteria bacterium]